jgi:hypothetical protein
LTHGHYPCFPYQAIISAGVEGEANMTAPAKTATRPSKAAKSAAKATAAKTTKAAPAKAAKAAKAPKAPKPVKYCLHGCGLQTKGGDFVIGHDAKLKSILQKAHVAGEKSVDLGDSPLSGQAPMAIAKARGWESFLDKAKASADEKANRPKRQPKVKGGPVEVGSKVQFTYRGKKRTGEVTEVAGERAKVKFAGEDGESERAFGKESLTVTG